MSVEDVDRLLRESFSFFLEESPCVRYAEVIEVVWAAEPPGKRAQENRE